ncbi:MAG: class F420-dependent oxidoreductase [Ilumatobacteraceae bacterium]|nr:class F420-dependent oxidoreductase [Ilumatobacteraceae bacterium]
MRLGLMVGPERARYATKVDRMLRDAKWAEDNGLSTVWIPQVPDEFDAMTAAALVAHQTSRIEIGTAVVPLQSRHPIALVQQSLSTQLIANGRFTLGLGPSHHWIIQDMLGLPYERPAALTADYLDVVDAAMAGPGPITVANDSFHIDNPMYVTDQPRMQVMLAALGPLMLELAGARTDGTILWLADEQAIESHIAPRINAAAAAAGRPAPRIVAGVPVCLCRPDEVDAARARANRVLSEATISPNYQRLLDRGSARSVADILAAGDEEMVRKRLAAFADAGVTDVSVRVLPIGDDRDALLESSRRTRDLVASLATSFG